MTSSEGRDNVFMSEKDIENNSSQILSSNDTDEDQIQYPPKSEALIVLFALALTIFLSALDRTIIATAIPKITDEFHSINDIGWYGSAFLLTSCCLLLLAGRIYTFYSPKHVFLIVLVIFEIGSAICGAAPNSTVFIIGRAIAGIGGAGVMNGSITLLSAMVPLAKRPKYSGLFGASFGIASVVGPLLGGVFTSRITWRWCFYINLPIGAVTIGLIAWIVKPIPARVKNVPIKQQLLQLDPLGSSFLIPALVCLLLALQWGGTTYDWSSSRIIALLVVFSVLFTGFVLVQIFKNETATIPARIIKNRSILAAMVLTFCLNASLNVLIFYMPLWFQAVQEVDAFDSGIRTFPTIISMVLGIIFSGVLTGKIGYYTPLAYASVIIAPIGAGLICTWTPETSQAKWIAYQVIAGFGNGLGFQQANMAAQTVLKHQDVPMGSSIVQFAQLLGGTVFISVGQNLFSTRLASGIAPLVPNIDPRSLGNMGATELLDLVGAAKKSEFLSIYNDALRSVFLLATALAALAAIGAVGLEWKSVKKVEKQDAKPEEK